MAFLSHFSLFQRSGSQTARFWLGKAILKNGYLIVPHSYRAAPYIPQREYDKIRLR